MEGVGERRRSFCTLKSMDLGFSPCERRCGETTFGLKKSLSHLLSDVTKRGQVPSELRLRRADWRVSFRNICGKVSPRRHRHGMPQAPPAWCLPANFSNWLQRWEYRYRCRAREEF